MKLRCFLIAIVLLTFILIPKNSNAQVFWNGSKYGMTVKEIQSLFPESYTPEKPDTVKNNLNNVESVGLLKLDETIIDDNRFEVDFFFNKENRLQQVNLKLKASNGSLSMFERFLLLFRSKYGQEINNKVDDYIAWKLYTAIWISGKTNLNLIYTVSFEEPLIFYIVYTISLYETSKKL